MIDDWPLFVVTFCAEPGCPDPIRALRALLKRAPRDQPLKCVDLAERLPAVASSTAALCASS
jgi:hypothetical protein